MIRTGDKAPAFKLTDEDGRAVKLADYRGKKNSALFLPARPDARLHERSLRVSG